MLSSIGGPVACQWPRKRESPTCGDLGPDDRGQGYYWKLNGEATEHDFVNLFVSVKTKRERKWMDWEMGKTTLFSCSFHLLEEAGTPIIVS